VKSYRLNLIVVVAVVVALAVLVVVTRRMFTSKTKMNRVIPIAVA